MSVIAVKWSCGARSALAIVTVLALAAGAAYCASPKGEPGAGKVYVSPVKGPKPYPEGRPWRWAEFRSKAIESKDRKQDPWIKGLEGAAHPMVLLESKDVPTIRERLKRGAGPRIMEHLRRHATGDEVRAELAAGAGPGRMRWVRLFAEGRQITSAGLYAMLADKPEVAKDAVAKLISLSGREIPGQRLPHGRSLYTAAMGYDLLYNYMTPEQRKVVRTALDESARTMYFHKPFGGDNAEGNWVGHCWSPLGVAGFALQEENRYAPDWIRQGRVANLLYLHNTFDPEGADYEAFSRYFAMGIRKVIITCATERRHGRDFFTYRNNIFNRIVEFASYMLMPSCRDWAAFDDAFARNVDFKGLFAEVAGLTGDPLAQGVFEAVYGEKEINVGDPLTAAVFYDPDIKAERRADSRRLSLAKAYRGFSGKGKGLRSSGHVFLRTGFDSPDDIYFAGQCGDNAGWHGHADQSSFVLAAYGDVLVQDPAIIGGYGEPLCEWMKGPESHSLVLIDGLASPNYTPGEGGVIEELVHTDTLDFVSMDFLKGLHLNKKMRKARRGKRYVVFFRHPKRTGYFVIVDDVIMDSKARKYEWLLQPDSKHKPVEEGPGEFAFTGRVDLKIRMIEPKDPVYTTATYKGYGVDYLRIRSKEDRSRGLFFTILYPKKKDMSVPPITEIRQDGVIGAKIGEDIVLFRTKEGAMDAGGVKSDGELVAIRVSGGAPADAVVMGGGFLRVNGKDVAFTVSGARKLP